MRRTNVSGQRPNICFIMSDDHAAHAISAYGSRVNTTPHIDRIAAEGMRFDNCFCTNSICTPSRAAILAGTYNHVNGVRTLFDSMDNTLPTFISRLHDDGYQTAVYGKWHLGHGAQHDPAGFDDWAVLPGQGLYHDPVFHHPDGQERKHTGYVTDIITDMSLDWLGARDPDRPFALLIHHKAPHRRWEPDAKHAHMYDDVDLPLPETFDDDYATRASAASDAAMRIDRDLSEMDTKGPVPEGLSPAEAKKWKYERYLKAYLACVASVDDNVGRVLDWLDEQGLADNTIVVYTSDQGFFLGDHGWYDKRFMYEESLRMPLLVRYPPSTPAGSVCSEIVTNVDFSPTFLDLAGLEIPDDQQGFSLADVLAGQEPAHRQDEVYYRYWEHLSAPHKVQAHYGIRTRDHKLICYAGRDEITSEYDPARQEWELFDLAQDRREIANVYGDPAYARIQAELTERLFARQAEVGDVAEFTPISFDDGQLRNIVDPKKARLA
jgi:arylsulfatase A-like enzyme